MGKRKSLGKKVRFDVFKRDEFSCQYCGRTTPAVTLEIDHVIPVSEGGSDELHNLITACFDCNRGKGAEMLEKVPETIAKRSEIEREREDQVKAYERMLKNRKRRLNKSVNAVEAQFQEFFPNKGFTPAFKSSVKTFVERLSETEVCDAMAYSAGRITTDSPDRVTAYFCGVCWSKIKERSA